MDEGPDAEWRSDLQAQLKEVFAILGDQCQDLRQVSCLGLFCRMTQPADLQTEYPALMKIDRDVFTPLVPAG